MPKPDRQRSEAPEPEEAIYELMIRESGSQAIVDDLIERIHETMTQIAGISDVTRESDKDLKDAARSLVKTLYELENRVHGTRADVVRHCTQKTTAVREHFGGILSNLKKTRLTLQSRLV